MCEGDTEAVPDAVAVAGPELEGERVGVGDGGDRDVLGLRVPVGRREKVWVKEGVGVQVAVGEWRESVREGLAGVALVGVLERDRVGAGGVTERLRERLALQVGVQETVGDAETVAVGTRVEEPVAVEVKEGPKVSEVVLVPVGEGEGVVEGVQDVVGPWLLLRLLVAVGAVPEQEAVGLMEWLGDRVRVVRLRDRVDAGEGVGLREAEAEAVTVRVGVQVDDGERLPEHVAEHDAVPAGETVGLREGENQLSVRVEGVLVGEGVWDRRLAVAVVLRVSEAEGVPLGVRDGEAVDTVRDMDDVHDLWEPVRLSEGLPLAVDGEAVTERETEGVEAEGVLDEVGGEGVRLVYVKEAALNVGVPSRVQEPVMEADGLGLGV